jgi:hypothetical protein
MGLNAVLQHVKGVVNGIAIPGQQKTLTAAVVPPPLEPMSGVLAYVTPGRMTGRRQTSPRGPGFTEPHWPVDITLDLEDLSADPVIEQVFPLAVDAVLAAIWADTMPVFITDPTTGIRTQLLAIGEDYGYDPADWKTTASGRMVLFRGRITTTVKEAFQTGAYTSGGTVIP